MSGATDGQGTNARFASPSGISFDAFGYLLVGDLSNQKIRRISPDGEVSSLTGNASLAGAVSCGKGNGNPLDHVYFSGPYHAAADPTNPGTLMITENVCGFLRKLTYAFAPTTSLGVCDGLWHAVATTFSGGANPQTVNTYIDGWLTTTSAVTMATTGSASSPLTIGATGEAAAGTAGAFTGAVSDLRVFARALSQADVAALHMTAVPPFAGATFSPPLGLDVMQYTYSCLPGYAGPATATFTCLNDWSWALSAPANCSACPAQTYAAVTATASVCRACSTVNANAVAPSPGSQFCTCSDNFYMTGAPPLFGCSACPDGSTASGGPASCTCNANFVAVGAAAALRCSCPEGFASLGAGATMTCSPLCAANTYSAVRGGACAACPANSLSDADSRTCICAANSAWNGLVGAALVCTACPSNAVSAGGYATACTCTGLWDYFNATSNTCITPPSATPSATASPSASQTPSRTPTPTSSITASITPSNTASPSPTPSVTPVPDVVLSFAFAIAPAAAGALKPSDLAGQASVVAAITSGYAQLLSVSPSLVTVANFTDVATGAVVAATPLPHARRLLGAPGSKGVSVSVIVALGKTPTQAETISLQTTLASASPRLASLQTAITASVASALQMPASAFVTSAPAAVNFVGSPYIASSTTIIAAADNSAPATGGAAVGGVIGAVLLACAVWSCVHQEPRPRSPRSRLPLTDASATRPVDPRPHSGDPALSPLFRHAWLTRAHASPLTHRRYDLAGTGRTASTARCRAAATGPGSSTCSR